MMLVSQFEIRAGIELFVGARTAESSTLFMGFSASTPLFRSFQFLAGVTHQKATFPHPYIFISFCHLEVLHF